MASFSIPNQDATIIKELVISDNVNKHLKSKLLKDYLKLMKLIKKIVIT